MFLGVPRGFDYKAVKRDLQMVPGVKSVHSLNVWSLTMDTVLVNVHLAVGKLIDISWYTILSYFYHLGLLSCIRGTSETRAEPLSNRNLNLTYYGIMFMNIT